MDSWTGTFLPLITYMGLMMACSSNESRPYLAQGIMAGEVTDHSVILQTRLTASDTLLNGDVRGFAGWACFEMSPRDLSSEVAIQSPWRLVSADYDYILKDLIDGLSPDQTYQYRVRYGVDTSHTFTSRVGSFRTLAGSRESAQFSMVVVTGMNYYHFHYGAYDSSLQYQGPDKHLGYPALKTILDLRPDYFLGTGDNVYFDHPAWKGIQRARTRNKDPLLGLFGGHEVTDEQGMRRKYHVQFVQPRFKELFLQVASYWEKDDHDYRINDSDPYIDFPISHQLGIKNFKEQLPVTDPDKFDAVTYRSHRISKDFQVWLLEGRDYRSANSDPDVQGKTIWGSEQLDWLHRTLLASDAAYKIIISPTPLVGPDGGGKSDSHVNLGGFRHEGDAFFRWLIDHQFSKDSLFIVCGDRHWQYHAIHPSGFHEFSCGALVDANSRAGVMAGDPKSTDPEGEIKQPYVQGTADQATGGFLLLNMNLIDDQPSLDLTFFDEKGALLYEVEK